jgi:hypothetical protein
MKYSIFGGLGTIKGGQPGFSGFKQPFEEDSHLEQ